MDGPIIAHLFILNPLGRLAITGRNVDGPTLKGYRRTWEQEKGDDINTASWPNNFYFTDSYCWYENLLEYWTRETVNSTTLITGTILNLVHWLPTFPPNGNGIYPRLSINCTMIQAGSTNWSDSSWWWLLWFAWIEIIRSGWQSRFQGHVCFAFFQDLRRLHKDSPSDILKNVSVVLG